MTMGRLTNRFFIFVLFLTFGIVSASSMVKRDTNDDLLSNVELLTKDIPIVGRLILFLASTVCRLVQLIQNITNGPLGQILNDILPCTSTVNGTQCDGLDKNGGITNITVNVLENVLGLPGVLTPVIEAIVSDTLNLVENCNSK